MYLGISLISTSKEKIEKVNEEKREASAIVVGGDLPKYYSHFKSHIAVNDSNKEGGGSVVKWSCEYEKTTEEIPIPHLIRDFAVKNFQDLDAYIQASPN